jgi:hypothetical protein
LLRFILEQNYLKGICSINFHLLNQAVVLYSRLSQKMWKAAASKDKDRWQRLEVLSSKALARWERRQEKNDNQIL